VSGRRRCSASGSFKANRRLRPGLQGADKGEPAGGRAVLAPHLAMANSVNSGEPHPVAIALISAPYQ